jgi:tetratricopeptide (TPR) repeat protein
MTLLRVKLLLLLLTLGLFLCFIGNKITASETINYLNLRKTPELPLNHFSPSNAQTEDGNLIPSEQFFTAKRCVSCHQETHAQWSESLHRNAARAPFYLESVKILERQRGIEFTRHCESCHAPVALLSGALTTGSRESRTMDDEGVTCTVCHSITEAKLDGTGSYTIRRPALLVNPNSEPIFGDVSDQEIMDNVPDHKRAMMRDLLKKPEFCATCHKASAPRSLNNYKFTRGFNTFDEWQMSGASTETITPYYRAEKRADCRTCHMPLAGDGQPDVAAENGMVASHRFLGANTATPLFYGQLKQVGQIKEFLEKAVLTADIFAVRNETTDELFPSLKQDGENPVAWQAEQQLTAEVIIFNRRAAHSFPPELRDMYEPWVEFEALDDKAQTIYHSGYLRPDRTLDEKAHVYKAILLDSFSRVITRHQVWTSAIKAYDNFVPPGRGDIVRYRFSVPQDVKKVTLRARVNYRRFIQEYADYVLRRNNAANLEMPVVKMAETSTTLINKIQVNPTINSSEQEAKRWNDYGIGLLEQMQNSQAAAAFKKAFEFNPKNADYPVSAAIAEMRMERYAIGQLDQLKRADDLIAQALKIAPDLPRARFYRAVVVRAFGKTEEAVRIFGDLSRAFPRDREVQRQFGQTLFAQGRIDEAKRAFLAIQAIDPTDAGAYRFLSPILASEGLQEEAQKMDEFYLLWRDDPLAEVVATRFFAANSNWAEVRVPFHVYSAQTPPRPTMTGARAAPER